MALLFSSAHAQERIEPALESQPVPETREKTGTEPGQSDLSQGEAEADRIMSALLKAAVRTLRTEEDSAQRERQEQLIAALHAIEAAVRNFISEEDSAQRDRQEQHQVADLMAQQDMAYWAKVMVWVTAGTVGLTAIGGVLLWRTLIHTRRAAEAAAADYVAAHRPWLTVMPTIEGDLTLYKDIAFLEAAVTVKNIGRSPATNIAVEFKLENTGNRWLADEIRDFAAMSIITQNRDVADHQGTSLFPDEHIIVRERLDTGTTRERIVLSDNRPHIFLSLFVSVNYAFEFQKREPITAVAYRLFRTDRSDGHYSGDFFIDEPKVQRDVLRLEPSRGSLIQ